MTVAARKIRLIMELRRAGISDTHVLSAIERIPREAFVPESFRDQAYENRALPIGFGQTLSQPGVVAAMTQALRTDRRLRVLEVGTGSGYQAAVLSRLCRRLYTIERHRDLQREAEARFQRLRLHNITARVGDGGKGWPEQAPFSRIVVTAAAPQVPGALVDQLVAGGILVVPVGRPGADQDLVRLTRENGVLTEERLGRVRFVPLLAGPPACASGPPPPPAGPGRPTLA
ncbi:MAG: protein-L-isoaspartate(D-aspartate) O-methyltransferase [Kiloniellaceae bacterium]